MVAKNSRKAPKNRKNPTAADSLWVSRKITTRFSHFHTIPKVMDLLTKYTFRADGNDAYLDIIACAPDEPCCFGKPDSNGRNHTYFFKTIFLDLEYKLPLSDFTCSSLTLMNIAPTQLSANGWAYLRAFELLCVCLNIVPTCKKFFSFFETSGMKVKGEYISLSSARGSGLFTLFRSNYKHWKAKFFKLRESEQTRDIFYFDDGTPRFPFYWTDKPELIYKVPETSLTIDEKLEVDFLSTINLNLTDFYDAFKKKKT